MTPETKCYIYSQLSQDALKQLEPESPLTMCFLLTKRIFQLTPNRSLTAHTEWLAGIASASLVQYVVRDEVTKW